MPSLSGAVPAPHFLDLAREDPALECEHPTRPLTQWMISPNLRLEHR